MQVHRLAWAAEDVGAVRVAPCVRRTLNLVYVGSCAGVRAYDKVVAIMPPPVVLQSPCV